MAAFASGFVSSGIASVTGGLTKNLSDAWQTTATIASGVLGGGLAAEFAGGSFIEGFRNGAIIAALNHVAHRVTEGKDPRAARKARAKQARQQRLNKMHANLKSAVTKFGEGFNNPGGTTDLTSGSSLAGMAGAQIDKTGALLNSTGASSNVMNATKVLGRFAGVAGIGFTAYEGTMDGNFTYGDGTKVSISAGVFGLTQSGNPYAAGADYLYIAVDFGYAIFTGSSLTDRIGAGVDNIK